MIRPESYSELTQYLNTLSAWAWKRLLRANETNGNKGIVMMLRAVCGNDISNWSDDDLMKYLACVDITNENDYPLDCRL